MITAVLIIAAIVWLLIFLLDVLNGRKGSTFNPLVSAVLVTMSAVLISIHSRISDIANEKSKFYLEKAIDGFGKAEAILLAGGNEREAWIGAARVLEKSRKLSEEVTIDEHQDVFDIEMDFQRHRFSQFFKYPAKHYYGVPSNTVLTLDEAARYSTERSGTTVSTLKQVPEGAIYTIYDFMKYPENYNDPIKDNTFTDREIMFLGYDGLKQYLDHIHKYHSAAGKLFPKKEGESDS